MLQLVTAAAKFTVPLFHLDEGVYMVMLAVWEPLQ